MLSALAGNWRVSLGLAAITFVVAFGLGVRWQRGADALDQVRTLAQAAEARQKREEDARRESARLQSRLATLEAANREINRRLINELKNPAYDCPIPAGGVQLRRDALEAAK